MEFSVIIPAGRASDSLRRTLTSCLEQELLEEWEVIVVCNPPNPEIEELAGSIESKNGARVRVLHNEERGVNRAKNRAIDEARGKILYFLDDDCVFVRKSHLRRLQRAHERNPSAAGIGGYYQSPERAPTTCRFYNTLVNAWLARSRDRFGRQTSLVGGNAAYKRRIFDEGFRFDASISYGGDETEFNHRLVAAHEILLLDGDSVVHDFRSGWLSIFRRAWLHGLGKAQAKSPLSPQDRSSQGIQDPALRRQIWTFAPILLVYRLVVEAAHRFGHKPPAEEAATTPKTPSEVPVGSTNENTVSLGRQ